MKPFYVSTLATALPRYQSAIRKAIRKKSKTVDGWGSRVLNFFSAKTIQYFTILRIYLFMILEEKTLNFRESPKSAGWLGGVRCLGQSPKNNIFSDGFLYAQLH